MNRVNYKDMSFRETTAQGMVGILLFIGTMFTIYLVLLITGVFT